MARIYAQQTVKLGNFAVLNDATVFEDALWEGLGTVKYEGREFFVRRLADGSWTTTGPAKDLPDDLPKRNDPLAARRALTRGHGYETEDEVLQAARGWLLGGWAVRIVRAQDGTFTLEAWEA